MVFRATCALRSRSAEANVQPLIVHGYLLSAEEKKRVQDLIEDMREQDKSNDVVKMSSRKTGSKPKSSTDHATKQAMAMFKPK